MRRHRSSSQCDCIHAVELETYEFKFEYENVDCIHCKHRMTDYYDLEHWPFGAAEFHDAFKTVAKGMIEVGLEPTNPHLALRGDIIERQSSLHICPMCGWWAAVDSAVLPAIGNQYWLINMVAPAALIEFDLSDISVPIREVRNYLSRRFDSRYSVHPRLFEQTVASVFRDIGYDAQATAYSNDGGIDVVFRSGSGEMVGVQVKRHRRSIEVEQIRAFLGALVLGGFTRGVFVSTSKFQSGAMLASARCNEVLPIELVDSERFFDMLGIAQLSTEPEPEDCGFYDVSKPALFLHSSFHLNSI